MTQLHFFVQLLLWSLCLLVGPVECFVRGWNQQYRYSIQWPTNSPKCSVMNSKSSLLSTAPTPADPAARFHSDMHRVLTSRKNLMSSNKIPWNTLERRKRAEILSTDVDGAERVLSMLRHMVSIGVATEESYQIALTALVHRGRLRWRREDSLIVCAADEVTVLLEELWGLVEDNISTTTCNLALQAYAACATPRGNRQYAQRAQELLETMQERQVEITAESLSHLVHAWSWQQENLKSGECAKMAQGHLDRLLTMSDDVELLQQSYHWLLEAWSKCKDERAQEKAEQILETMISLQRKHPESKFPNANSFSNAILALSKAGGTESASKAQTLLETAVAAFERGDFEGGAEPELIAFNGVMSAWARLGRQDKAEIVLALMHRLAKKCPGLRPDIVTYNNVIHAHLKSKDKGKALDRILTLVQEMEDQKYVGVKPDSFTYSIVLKAWVQSWRPDAAIRAVETLTKMRELWVLGDVSAKPSNRHYNIVINALAKSREHLDSQKAYELLMQMQASKDYQPDIISYTSVIECFSKSNDPEAAKISLELLDQARTVYEQTKNPNMMPNMLTYSMVISSMSTNPTLPNVLKARELLIELLVLYDETKNAALAPNVYPFNHVLNCAANCIGSAEEKAKAFHIAAQTYNDVRKRDDVQPDSYTYAFWFKCCNNLLPVGEVRSKGVTLVFDQCKADGLVSGETLRRLLAGTPQDVATNLLGLDPKTPPAVYRQMTIHDVPPAWSRNVR